MDGKAFFQRFDLGFPRFIILLLLFFIGGLEFKEKLYIRGFTMKISNSSLSIRSKMKLILDTGQLMMESGAGASASCVTCSARRLALVFIGKMYRSISPIPPS